MRSRVDDIEDACVRAVHASLPATPRQMADACVAALGPYRLDDGIGGDEVAELVARRAGLAAAALDMVLFGRCRGIEEWVSAAEADVGRLLERATPPGGRHGSVGTWAVGRPAAGGEGPTPTPSDGTRGQGPDTRSDCVTNTKKD